MDANLARSSLQPKPLDSPDPVPSLVPDVLDSLDVVGTGSHIDIRRLAAVHSFPPAAQLKGIVIDRHPFSCFAAAAAAAEEPQDAEPVTDTGTLAHLACLAAVVTNAVAAERASFVQRGRTFAGVAAGTCDGVRIVAAVVHRNPW